MNLDTPASPHGGVAISALRKRFPNGDRWLEVLRGLDVVLEPGEIVSVSGASGSGKSTLLSLLAGLERPDDGAIVVDGRHVERLSGRALDDYRGETVGLIFQAHHLLADFTARENVMLPALTRGRSRVEAGRRADALLERVGLRERSTHLPSTLSGGERQRVAVARALINDPTLILADEPTGNLDPEAATAVADLLFAVAAERGSTLVVVTHDADLARRAPRPLRLEHGCLAEHRS